LNNYDIDSPSFRPEDIWTAIPPNGWENHKFKIKEFDIKEIDKIVCLNGDIHNILKDLDRKPVFGSLRKMIDEGQLLRMPAVTTLFPDSERYVWDDGIHRTVLYFDMFNVDTMPIIVLGGKKSDKTLRFQR